MTFTLPVQWWDGWKELEAVLLPDIAPHLAGVASFALVRDPFLGKWCVTNIECGQAIRRAVSREDALEDARVYLRTKTARQFQLRYRKVGEKFSQIGAEMRLQPQNGRDS